MAFISSTLAACIQMGSWQTQAGSSEFKIFFFFLKKPQQSLTTPAMMAQFEMPHKLKTGKANGFPA